MPEPADPAPKTYVTKPREFERVNAPPGTLKKSADHDVYAILQHNRAVEQRDGLKEVVLKKTTSRRKRDYGLLLLSGNLLLAVLAWLGRGNAMVLVCTASGMIVFSLGLTWILWFVMDDY